MQHTHRQPVAPSVSSRSRRRAAAPWPTPGRWAALVLGAGLLGACGGGGGGGSSAGADCSVAPFPVAGLGGVLLLPGDQGFSRANFGENGQLLWAWDQAIGNLDETFQFEWVLDASAETGLEDRTISYTVSDDGEVHASGQTTSFGAGATDVWVAEYTCDGSVVAGSQTTFGSPEDDVNVFLFNDVHQNQSFDLEDDSGESHVHWLNGLYIPDPLAPFEFHAIVGRLDSEDGSSWARSADLGGPIFRTARAWDGSVSLSTLVQLGGPAFEFEGYLVHLDEDGDVVWERATAGGYDTFSMVDLTRLTDGRLVACGGSESGSGARRALTVAFSDSGVEWSHSLGALGDVSFSGAIPLPGGDLVAFGSGDVGGTGFSDAFVVRMEADGDVVWSKAYGTGTVDHAAEQLALMPDGSLAVLARVGSADAWVGSLDGDGDLQWQAEIVSESLAGDSFELVEPARTESFTSSKVMVVGRKQDVGPGDLAADVFAVVFDETGAVDSELQWTSTAGGSQPTVYSDAVSGSLYLFAVVESTQGPGAEDALLVRYDADLEFQWAQYVGGAGDDTIRHLDFDHEGGILVCGLTDSFHSTDTDPFLLGLDLQGQTTSTCWIHAATTDTFPGVSPAFALTSTVALDLEPVEFLPISLIETPDFSAGTASHAVDSALQTLDDACIP